MARDLRILIALGLALIIAGGGTRPAAARDLTVVELYTSQGCSSCPPADAFLRELAERPDILALSFHVDYWDYIGWKDPFANTSHTERQRAYARQFGLSYVYTPQIVVHGTAQAVGSNRPTVLNGIAQSQAMPQIPVDLQRRNDQVIVALPAIADADDATVWSVVFDRDRETAVTRGENRGRTLRYVNVVRDLKRLATWRGKALEIPVPVVEDPQSEPDACAILVQSQRSGRILGAAAIDLQP